MTLYAAGQLPIFLYMFLAGISGGIIGEILSFFRGEFSNKVMNIVFDFVSVILNFSIYFLLDLKLENGNKRFFTVVGYLIGVTATIITIEFIKKKWKEKKKNV